MANIGFAVNNNRKNAQTGQWEDVPVWVELKAFSNEKGRKLADLVEKYLRKGSQAYVEGHLVLEEWAGKEDGKKQSKMVVYVDSIEFLGSRGDAPAGGAEQEEQPAKKAAKKAPAETGGGEGMDEVPF